MQYPIYESLVIDGENWIVHCSFFMNPPRTRAFHSKYVLIVSFCSINKATTIYISLEFTPDQNFHYANFVLVITNAWTRQWQDRHIDLTFISVHNLGLQGIYLSSIQTLTFNHIEPYRHPSFLSVLHQNL